MIWPECVFEPKTSHPLNHKRPKDMVCFDQNLFEFYRKLLRIPKENKVLSIGEIKFIDVHQNILCYRLIHDKYEIIVFINIQPLEVQLNTKLFQNEAYIELQNHKTYLKNKLHQITIPAMGCLIFSVKN